MELNAKQLAVLMLAMAIMGVMGYSTRGGIRSKKPAVAGSEPGMSGTR